ncbi:MAG TPA: COX15/CtaA family protein [Candidatus Polarisedimenticolaceae bacterium]|nr:COX15/CtaA family protein [Candidatus Polarisedimenticolaceae bacterium]
MRGSDIVAVGFGTTVAMWTVGYIGMLPVVGVPTPLLLAGLVLCLLAGGAVLGRFGARGFGGGAEAGALCGVLNLLVLGSLLGGTHPGEIVPSALLWIPGSVLFSAVLAGIGAAGARARPRGAVDWLAVQVRVTVVATLLLLAVGGIVTSNGAGLAVVDWPNSFGYNMFLFPLRRMTGLIYYEHAHRLFGALVGLTTLVTTFSLQRAEPRRWVRVIGWIALGTVIVQGVLGGLRVTGRFTLSTSSSDTIPSLISAVIHGTLGQLFLATLVALAAFTSPAWRRGLAFVRRRSVRTDRALSVALVLVLIVQILLGAAQRHLGTLLMAHVVGGMLLVPGTTLLVGLRAWGLSGGNRRLHRLGLALLHAMSAQVLLGFASYVAAGAVRGGSLPPAVEVVVTTAHQWLGAVLLGLAVTLACWNFRLLAVADAPSAAA